MRTKYDPDKRPVFTARDRRNCRAIARIVAWSHTDPATYRVPDEARRVLTVSPVNLNQYER